MSKIVNWSEHYVYTSRLHCELLSCFLNECQINKLQVPIPH